MDSITQESVRKKKKKVSEKFIPPQFTAYNDIQTPESCPKDEVELPSLPIAPALSDEELRPVLSSAKKRRLRKKQALEKKQLLTAKSSASEINKDCVETSISDTNNSSCSVGSEAKQDFVVDKNDNSSEISLASNSNLQGVLSSYKVKNTAVDRLSEIDNSSELNAEVVPSEVIQSAVTDNSKIITMTNDKSESKSREEVKAEREAKKLAKQQQKLKKSTAGDFIVNETSDNAPIQNNSAKTVIADSDTTAGAEQITVEINELKINEKDVKSKSELKAERRALQDAQRAAKDQALVSKSMNAAKIPTPQSSHTAKTTDVSKAAPKISLEESKKVADVKNKENKPKMKMYQENHKVKLFQHLYAEREIAICAPHVPINSKEIHPAIMKLGVRYNSGVVVGSNARCIALLSSLKEVVRDFSVPAQAEFGRALEARLVPGMDYLHRCRPLAVSMQNALKHFRYQLRQLPNDILESEAKIQLNEAIDTYIREQIEVAGQAISLAVRNKISDGDVILTYACSSLVEQILCDAWAAGIRFSVMVVGARPRREGQLMLSRLAAYGLPCTLVDISALSYIMKRVSLVVLGAGALLANGSVLGRVGTASVALAAAARNVPALVCCQTYKFSERVQADSFVYNEIGDPDEVVGDGPLQGWRCGPPGAPSGPLAAVQPLQLLYDVTPPHLVAAVITEIAIVPCTSVPVVLRFKLSEYGI